MLLLAIEIEELSKPYDIVVVETIHDLAAESRESIVERFFEVCKELCDKNNRTIIMHSPFTPYDAPTFEVEAGGSITGLSLGLTIWLPKPRSIVNSSFERVST